MPHRIDIDSVKKNVFLLRNLAYAGKKFAASHDLDYFSELNEDDTVNYNYYFGWLRYCLSEMLIDCAIKVRIIHDIIIKEHRESVEFNGESLYEEVKDFPFKFPTTHNIGFFSTGSGNLTLRETLNKIVHGNGIYPITAPGESRHLLDEGSKKRNWEYWNGEIETEGKQGELAWAVHINLIEFLSELSEFLSICENQVDWYHVYKHDI